MEEVSFLLVLSVAILIVGGGVMSSFRQGSAGHSFDAFLATVGTVGVLVSCLGFLGAVLFGWS